MIKQKQVTVKNAGGTLTTAEMGDVVVTTPGVTIALPAAKSGLWYAITNAANGAITVNYIAGTTTISQEEQALFLSNGAVWVLSKGGGKMTKAEIEAVLTGEITSHGHPVDAKFIDLEDAPAGYEGNAGKAIVVNQGETGLEFGTAGGGASAFIELMDTPDSYSGQQGKFPRVNSTEDGVEFATVAPGSGASSFVDLDDVPSSLAGQGGKVVAVNAAGSALEFIDAPTGDGSRTPSGDGTEGTYTGTLAASSASFSGLAICFEALENVWISAIKYYMGSATDNDVTINFRTSGSEMKAQKTGITLNTEEWNTVIFDSPIYLSKNSYYIVEILYSSGSNRLYRTTSTLYTGTLWSMVQNKVNNFFGAAYSETPGFGLIEYDDNPSP